MNRRQLMIAAPAAAYFTGSAGASDTPAMTAFRDWKQFNEYLDGPLCRGMDEDEFHQLVLQQDAKLVRLVMTPSQDYRDFCAKVAAYTFMGQDWPDDGGRLSEVILREACELLGSQAGRQVGT